MSECEQYNSYSERKECEIKIKEETEKAQNKLQEELTHKWNIKFEDEDRFEKAVFEKLRLQPSIVIDGLPIPPPKRRIHFSIIERKDQTPNYLIRCKHTENFLTFVYLLNPDFTLHNKEEAIKNLQDAKLKEKLSIKGKNTIDDIKTNPREIEVKGDVFMLNTTSILELKDGYIEYIAEEGRPGLLFIKLNNETGAPLPDDEQDEYFSITEQKQEPIAKELMQLWSTNKPVIPIPECGIPNIQSELILSELITIEDSDNGTRERYTFDYNFDEVYVIDRKNNFKYIFTYSGVFKGTSINLGDHTQKIDRTIAEHCEVDPTKETDKKLRRQETDISTEPIEYERFADSISKKNKGAKQDYGVSFNILNYSLQDEFLHIIDGGNGVKWSSNSHPNFEDKANSLSYKIIYILNTFWESGDKKTIKYNEDAITVHSGKYILTVSGDSVYLGKHKHILGGSSAKYNELIKAWIERKVSLQTQRD